MLWKKRLTQKGTLLLACFAFLIAACSPARTPQTAMPSEIRTAASTRTFTPAPKTATSTSTPSPVPEGTITITLAPTFTPIPPSSTPTRDLSGTQTVEEVISKSQPVVLQSSRSPDGKWQAEVIRYDCVFVGNANQDENAYELVKIVEGTTGKETVLDTQLQNCGGIGAYGLGIAFWSPDSRFVYYTHSRESVPDGCAGGWWRSLVAINVANSERTTLGWGPLSPDRKTLAYPAHNEIVLWDLNQGEIGRVPVLHAGWLVGDIAWSPRGDALVYMQNEEGCFEGNAAFIRIGVPGLVHTTLLETVSPDFLGVEWDSTSRIRLVDVNGFEWTVNLAPK